MFLISRRPRLDFDDGILYSMVLHRTDGFDNAVVDVLVKDQFRRCVIGHGRVLQAFLAATTEAIDFSRKRPGLFTPFLHSIFPMLL